MINWLKKTIGAKPDESKLIGHYFYQCEFIRDPESILKANFNRVETVEILIYLHIYQTNAAKIEIQSLHSKRLLNLVKLPDDNQIHTVFYLINEKSENLTLAINDKEAILELTDLNAGSIFTKYPPEPGIDTNEKEELLVKTEESKEDIFIYENPDPHLDVERRKFKDKYGIAITDTNYFILKPEYDSIHFEYASDFELRYLPKDEIYIPYFSVSNDEDVSECYFHFIRLSSKIILIEAKKLRGMKSKWGNYYEFRTDHKVGFLNSGGEVIFLEYSVEHGELDNSNSSLYTWNKYKDHYYIIDLLKQKQVVWEFEKGYKPVSPFQYDSAIVEKNDKYGIINLLGNITVPCIYHDLDEINGSFIIARKYDKSGIITINNEIILPFEYDEIYSIKNEYYLIIIQSKKGLSIMDGRIIFKPEFENIAKVNNVNNVFRLVKDDRVYFGNHYKVTTENYDITDNYIGYTTFFEGLLRVKKNGLIGYLNRDLNEVIPCIYKEGSICKNGKILVMADNSLKFINKKGEDCSFQGQENYSFENSERYSQFSEL